MFNTQFTSVIFLCLKIFLIDTGKLLIYNHSARLITCFPRRKHMKKLLIVVAVIAVLVMAVFGSYNSLVASNENVTSKWSQVENQLQRRSDLIPNLVNTVKGYAKHESDVFT